MKLYAPSYYKKFKCIADKCSHSCCIGWEIDIDPETQEKYDALTGGYGEKIKESIEISDTPHFKLQKNDRCPHLNKQGLCNIITNLGEGYLCEICREHPRFYNFTPQGCEVGLGMACEEACRVILSTDFDGNLTEIGELDGDACYEDLDTLPLRKRVIDLLATDTPYEECVSTLCDEMGIDRGCFELDGWTSVLKSLEYLDPEHKDLFLRCDGEYKCSEQALKRALGYFVYRHCATALDMAEFYQSLCFSLFCACLLRRVASSLGDTSLAARIVSEEIEYSTDNTDTVKQCFDF